MRCLKLWRRKREGSRSFVRNLGTSHPPGSHPKECRFGGSGSPGIGDPVWVAANLRAVTGSSRAVSAVIEDAAPGAESGLVEPLGVAVVSSDDALRDAAAAAFDSAPGAWSVTLHESRPEGADVVVVCPDVIPDPDGPPWVRFRPEAPGALLSEVARAAGSGSSLVVPVIGAGRGTGVTSVALHLCKALAGGASTASCFVDLDLEWGAAQRLGLEAAEVRTWAQAGATEEELVLSALPVTGGFRALLAPREAGPAGVNVVGRAAARWPRVVVDCPDAAAFDAAAGLCRGAVLVLPPTRPGAIRARTILRQWPGVQWAVVTNKMGAGGETTRAELQAVMERRVALELPCAPALRDAEDDGRLLGAPWSRWWRAIVRLARALERL